MRIHKSNEVNLYMPDSLRDLLNETYGRDWTWFRTGSSIIKGVDNPEDIDLMILVSKEKELILQAKNLYSYFLEPAYEDDKLMRITSRIIKDGELHKLDILITDDQAYFKRWFVSTSACTRLNILDKKERKNIFEYITKERYKLGAF